MLITGRGGEGVVLASQLLADTFARAGFWVQSFPEFKAERRGAQISAFVRWDDEPIRRRYKVRECDVLVSISASPPPARVVARSGLAGSCSSTARRGSPIAATGTSRTSPARAIARQTRHPLRRGTADGEHRRARRRGQAAPPRRARVSRAGDPRPYGQRRSPSRTSSPRARATSSARTSTRSPPTRRTSPSRSPRGPPLPPFAVSVTSSSGQPHRIVVGRAARDPRGVQRLRTLRALLPGGSR